MSIELPEEYRDWVEVKAPIVHEGAVLAVRFDYLEKPNQFPAKSSSRYLVPLKPKPTLPDVKPGAVIRYRSYGVEHRAIYHGNDTWDIFWNSSLGFCGSRTRPAAQLLDEVDDAGFTVELEGL